jgi:hypothetical protein
VELCCKKNTVQFHALIFMAFRPYIYMSLHDAALAGLSRWHSGLNSLLAADAAAICE